MKGKYSDASHICYAYRLFNGFTLLNEINTNDFSTDAGEPRGSSGPPILKILRRHNMVNVVVFIVRYFGGTKLGKKGLVDAYGTAARNVINQTVLIEWVKKERYLISCPIHYYGDLSQALFQMGGKILEDQSSNSLKWIVEINIRMINDLIKIVRTVTKGEGDLDRV